MNDETKESGSPRFVSTKKSGGGSTGASFNSSAPTATGSSAPKTASTQRVAPWHFTMLQLALAGADDAQIAKQLSKKPSTIKRLLRSEWAIQQIQQWHSAVMLGAQRERLDPIKRFQGLVEKAITKVEEKMSCGDDKTELLAACRILDNAGLSVVKRIEVSEDEKLRDLTPAQMAEVARTGRLPSSKVVLALEASK